MSVCWLVGHKKAVNSLLHECLDMCDEEVEQSDDKVKEDEVEEELADLAVDLLLLSQELINTKIKLESMCKVST